MAPGFVRPAHSGRRADRLVRLLRVAGLGGVARRLRRQHALAPARRHRRAQLLHRARRQRHRIRAHVGDQALRARAQVDPLVQLLRHLHGLARREAQLARGLLLQGRGGERRRRAPRPLALLHATHPQPRRRRQHAVARGVRGGRVGEAELAELVPVERVQARLEGLAAARQARGHRPVLARLEGLDLGLALDDQPERRALHPPGRQLRRDLAPQQRRQVEAHQVVDRLARVERVDQLAAQLARLAQRPRHRLAGDLVEDDAPHRAVAELPALAQQVAQQPGDRLALAVRVGGEVQGVAALERRRDRAQLLLAARDHPVLERVAGLGVDRAVLRHQLLHVAVGGQHPEVRAEVFLDGLGLGRRFDDHQVARHGGGSSGAVARLPF